MAHQSDRVSDADLAECLGRAVVGIQREWTRVAAICSRSSGNEVCRSSISASTMSWQPLATPLMRVGRTGRMPLAGDDAHCDLTLAFTKEVIAGMATGAEQPCNSLQFGIVRPDLVQSAEGTGPGKKGRVSTSRAICRLPPPSWATVRHLAKLSHLSRDGPPRFSPRQCSDSGKPD